MSLNKSIEHGKEHRKSYKGGKQYASSCCNHGSCPWCQSNRRYKEVRDSIRDKQKLNDLDNLKGENE